MFNEGYLDRTGICVYVPIAYRKKGRGRKRKRKSVPETSQCKLNPSLPSFPDAPLPYMYVCKYVRMCVGFSPVCRQLHPLHPPLQTYHGTLSPYTSTIFILFARALSFSSLQLPQYSACHCARASTLFSSMGRMTFCPSPPTPVVLAAALLLLLLLPVFSDSIILTWSHRRFSSASQFSHSLWIISFSMLLTTRIATSRSWRYDPNRWRVRRICRAVALLELDARAAPASSYDESNDVVFKIWRNVS